MGFKGFLGQTAAGAAAIGATAAGWGGFSALHATNTLAQTAAANTTMLQTLAQGAGMEGAHSAFIGNFASQTAGQAAAMHTTAVTATAHVTGWGAASTFFHGAVHAFAPVFGVFHGIGAGAGLAAAGFFGPALGTVVAVGVTVAVGVAACWAVCQGVKLLANGIGTLFHHEPKLTNQQRAGNAIVDQRSLNQAMEAAGPSIANQQSYDQALQNARAQASSIPPISGMQYGNSQDNFARMGRSVAKGGIG